MGMNPFGIVFATIPRNATKNYGKKMYVVVGCASMRTTKKGANVFWVISRSDCRR